MVSIFKAVRDNDIQLVNYFVDLSTGDENKSAYSISKQDNKWLKQYVKASGSKNYDLNKRSTKGRTPLHCAVTWNRVDIARLLIDCPTVNVNRRDCENGWTALHRALYMGNIEIAKMLLSRDGTDSTIKDWEDLTAFELYESTVSDTFPKERTLTGRDFNNTFAKTNEEEDPQSYNSFDKLNKSSRIGGTDIYTWGHNTNYVLGHLDSENKNRPERVNLQLESQRSPYIMQRPNYVIQSVAMSKYHMAILTSESSHNLLVCGFGRGGRLGIGSDLDTQFTPVPVPWPERIAFVALGRDHTIAVTQNGNVLSFGNNSFGQLGYETDNHNKDKNQEQLVPRKIQAQSLKKQPIFGAAASRVHSVVYTQTDVFTFGLNQGQLGYRQPDNEVCQTLPRKVSVSTEILQVVVNDNATAILTKSHEVILLCNYNQQKIILPVNRFPSNITVYKSEPNYPVKLMGSESDLLGAITNTGDVFLWTCSLLQSRKVEQIIVNNRKSSAGTINSVQQQSSTAIISAPKRIWQLRKSHLAAIDASIGQDADLIVCTKSGHLFAGRLDTNSKYKFNHVPYIQRCIRVCANSSGAFAAIRSEYLLSTTIKVTPSTAVDDLLTSLPHIRITKSLKAELEKVRQEMELAIATQRRKLGNLGTTRNNTKEDNKYQVKQEAIILQKYNTICAEMTAEAWRNIDFISKQDATLDVVFLINDKRIYCHSIILGCRSRIFERLSKGVGCSLDKHMRIELKKRSDDGRIEISIEQCQMASILLLLDYMYTDEYEHPMRAFFRGPALCFIDYSEFSMPSQQTIKCIQKDLVVLSNAFDLPHLASSAQSSFNHKPITSLLSDLSELLEKGTNTDVAILSQEGSVTKCHEVILNQRCPFFRNIFNPNSVWLQKRREGHSNCLNKGELIEINLDHIPKQALETIVKYIYSDQDDTCLFEGTEKDREELMMDYLLIILREADFLLLDRLKTIAEKSLVRFIKLRSATTIFEYADIYQAESLKKTCLQFIAVNLPVFLGSGMLDFVSELLIRDLEAHVRMYQIEQMPMVPRGSNFVFSPIDHLSLEYEDTEFSTSNYALSKGEGSVSLYGETLVTYYPETSHKELPSSKRVLNASQTLITNVKRNPPSSLTKTDSASSKTKKAIRVALDDLENELNQMNNQSKRKSSVGWAVPKNELLIEPPSLREIIKTENQPQNSNYKILKASALKKTSQKERRRLAQLQETTTASDPSVFTTKPVWGKVQPVEAKSISKIMAESVGSSSSISTVSNNSDKKGKKIYVPEELLDEIEDESGSNGSSRHTHDVDMKQDSFSLNKSIDPSFKVTLIHRHRPTNDTRDKEKRSFQTIQQQQELEENWLKGERPKKNILRIQKEEQAVESISQYYVQTMNIMSGEWFEISRLSTF